MKPEINLDSAAPTFFLLDDHNVMFDCMGANLRDSGISQHVRDPFADCLLAGEEKSANIVAPPSGHACTELSMSRPRLQSHGMIQDPEPQFPRQLSAGMHELGAPALLAMSC